MASFPPFLVFLLHHFHRPIAVLGVFFNTKNKNIAGSPIRNQVICALGVEKNTKSGVALRLNAKCGWKNIRSEKKIFRSLLAPLAHIPPLPSPFYPTFTLHLPISPPLNRIQHRFTRAPPTTMYDLLFNFLSQYVALNEAEKNAIIALDIFHSVPKGTILLKEGQKSKNSYFVLKGCLRKYYILDGEEKTTAFYTEMEAMTPHSATVGVRPKV